MTNFYSIKTKQQVFFEDGSSVQFIDNLYSTDNKDEIENLKNHPLTKQGRITLGALPRTKKDNVIQGVRNSDQVAKEVAEKVEKAVRFGELKGKLLNKEGEYRKDATDEEKEEYEQLKSELNK